MSTENNSQGFVINNKGNNASFIFIFLSFQPMSHKTYAWKMACNDPDNDVQTL